MSWNFSSHRWSHIFLPESSLHITVIYNHSFSDKETGSLQWSETACFLSLQFWLSLFYDSINKVPDHSYFTYYGYYILPTSLLIFLCVNGLKSFLLFYVILVIKIKCKSNKLWNLKVVNIYLLFKNQNLKPLVRILLCILKHFLIFYGLHAFFFFKPTKLFNYIRVSDYIYNSDVTWNVSYRNVQVLYIFYKVLNQVFSFYNIPVWCH